MLRRLAVLLLLAARAAADSGDVSVLVREALAAEERLDSAGALALFQQAATARPEDAFLQQKLARQYSDLVLDQPDDDARRRFARLALEHAERAVALAPRDPVNVLSVAVARGKVAHYSDTRTKIESARLIRESAERALALDPNYAWAHHILGRWHREVASLAAAKRWLVQLFYGGLPPASLVEAVQHLERAVELEPTEMNHWLELGFAYAATSRADDARGAWRRGLALPDRGKHDAVARQEAERALRALSS